MTKNYREAYKIHACSGILYNHESPRRNENFVSRKITKNLSLILKGKINKIVLGNINSKRDWGHAKDYVFAMWKMMQLNRPQDFVIGSGKTHTVRDFIRFAFQHVSLDYKKYIKIDKRLFRPNDKVSLKADFKKAKKLLNWKPTITFKSLVKEMVEHDLRK